MLVVALKMLLHKRGRFLVTIGGLSCLFFLSAAQLGMLVGWCNTVSAIIRHADADVWVMSPLTPAFDYGTALPKIRVYQTRGVEGVAWAEGMYMDWSMWQRPDGKRISIELVGLDESCWGGPWRMAAGHVDDVHLPEGVIVDQAFLKPLGVAGLGDEVEFYGQRAVVRGVSTEVRTFTASPFVFASLKSARRFDPRYRDDEVTYVLAKCAPGHTPEQVRDAVARDVPNVEVLTRGEFVVRTILYWMLETGVGITVTLTGILGFLVSAVVVSQTLFTITQDHLTNYATLLAIGFSRLKLSGIVFLQSVILGGVSWSLGSLAFYDAAQASAPTAVPLEMTWWVWDGVSAFYFATCVAASFLSLKSVLQLDPAVVFRG